MTTTAPVGPPAGSGTSDGTAVDKGLKSGSLGLVGSVVVGMASTAPAYSLAASLGLIVASGGAILAGVKAPAIMLLAFIPMYFIAVAYKELNEAEPDCGTTFTWATRAFGPIVGWMGGWGIIAADVIVMANLAQIAGAYSFTLADDVGIHNTLASNTFWSTVAGIFWIVIMTYICYRGIEVSARLQYGLLTIEVITPIMVAVVALIKVYSHTAPKGSLTPQLSWLWPGGLSFGGVIAPAVLTAAFIYWGWDTAVATNEEAADPGRTPGRAAVISTVLLLITYVLVTTSVVAFAGVGTDGIGLGSAANAADVFTAIGPALFGDSFLGHVGLGLLTVSILTSASASTQTTILPTARTALSMAVYKAVPRNFARIHPKYLTPTWSTIGMGAVSIGFYLLITIISTSLLAALIGSIGLQIAFYYGLTGMACAWFYRKTLLSSFRHLLMRGIIPLVGGIFLFAMFVYGLVSYAAADWLTDDAGKNVTIFGIGAVAVVGMLALGVGFVLIALQWWRSPDFFQGRTLPRRSADLVLVGVVEGVPSTLPGSGEQGTVIAKDLSNLPVGQVAIDPETGETFRKDVT
ncbi:amino acid transporter [Nakamurella sp. UYEF19]|uniref:APC family permease n=1 Tax=Nakamurella sp. UYEF19 TaxID=1756392 RepID=UPI003390E8BB